MKRKMLLILLLILIVMLAIVGELSSLHASEKPEIFVQLGHLDFSGVGSKAVLSHTGKYLSSAGDSGAIKLWEVETGREIKTLLGHSVNLTSLAFSHDDRYLLSGSLDKTIKLWDVSVGKEIRTFTGHKDFVISVAFSPDGKTAASLDGKEIKLWDIKTGGEIKSFQGNEHFGKDFRSIRFMIFSPDGKYLVSSCNGGGIVAWEVSSGARIVKIDRNELFLANDAVLLGFSSDGKVIIRGLGEIIFVDLFAKQAKKIPTDFSATNASPDGKYFLLAPPGLFELFDLNTGKKVWDLQSPSKDGSLTASFSPDNKFVLLYGSDNIIKLYDRATGNELRSFKSHVELPYSVAFSKDGKYAVVGSSVVKLWNLHKGGFDGVININKQLEQILSMYKEVEKSKDQQVAKKAEKLSKEVEYYSYASGKHFHDKKSNKYYRVDSPFGTNTIIFYEVPVDKYGMIDLADKTREINKFSAHTAEITDYILSDKYVLTGGKDKTIKLFEFPSGRHIRTFTGHLGEIKGLTFSPDEKYILSASTDGTTRLWDISTGKEIAQFISFTDGEWIVITPEGYYNSSLNGHKYLNIRASNTVYGIDQFYDVFYRPDIVTAKLKGEDISSLITLTIDDAIKNPPPTVEFTTLPKDVNQPKVKICYQAKSTGGGIGEVRLFHNGKLIQSDGFYRDIAKLSAEKTQLAALNSKAIYEDMRGVIIKSKADTTPIVSKSKGEFFEDCKEVEGVSGENEVSITAFNASNTVQSYMKTSNFNANIKGEEPHLYILSIGIDRYKDSKVNLKYAAKDATDIEQKLLKQTATVYKPQNIHYELLTNEKAGKGNIINRINELASIIKPNDGFILFVAGHGILLQNQYYMLTNDFNGKVDEISVISSNEIVEISKKIKSLSQLFIFDTCHAGGVDAIVSGLYDARMSVLAKKMGLHIYASANSVQAALDGYKGNGLFTYTLLDGLNNKKEADKNNDNNISIVELGEYSKLITTEISKKIGHTQTPLIINFGKDNRVYKLK